MYDKEISITQVYQLIVNEHLLSHDIPTSLDELIDKLRFTYLISAQSVDCFLDYIKENECEHIEWDTVFENVRRDYLFAKPRSQAEIVGEYSRWRPQ